MKSASRQGRYNHGMANVPTVDFWFDFASTYSSSGHAHCPCGARSRPFLLGPIFKAQGWDNSPFNIYPGKGRYMWRDLERICEALALSFKAANAVSAE